MKKNKAPEYWSMGACIGLCAAGGVVLGSLLQNVVLWLCLGASVGVVLGAVIALHKKRNNS